MNETSQHHSSQLFTVRSWPDTAGQLTTDWGGKVQHVQSEAWRHFREWDDLVGFLRSQMTKNRSCFTQNVSRSVQQLLVAAEHCCGRNE